MTFPSCLRLLLLACTLVSGCALQPPQGRTPSFALNAAETARTSLSQGVAPQAAAHPGQSGILPLLDAREAFAARVLLARSAERTLDVQYYIWHADVTGTLLLRTLYQAAERGVRVRLLLDDNGIGGMDALLAALSAHPNIEIRLFNPFRSRTFKVLGYLGDFKHANRRMHNKSFTADNAATVIGGRNVGDEYFGAADDVLFTDLDVLASGQVVTDVSSDFDLYWASDSAYPIEQVVHRRAAADPATLEAAGLTAERDPKATRYLEALRDSKVINDLRAGQLALQWSPVRVVSDDPAKGQGEADPEELLMAQLKRIFGQPASKVDLVSPYFVPGDRGVQAFADMAARGVRVRVLTNSLEATDVAAVHAGYAKRRKTLLKAGVKLYEMKRQGNPDADFGGGSGFGSSGSSLHAKTFQVDGKRVFIGSFNFDPRSRNLNTEMGFVIDSPTLAGAIDQRFDTQVPADSYEVRLGDDGELYWLERRDGQTIRHDTEPGTNALERLGIGVLSVLPIEWLL